MTVETSRHDAVLSATITRPRARDAVDPLTALWAAFASFDGDGDGTALTRSCPATIHNFQAGEPKSKISLSQAA